MAELSEWLGMERTTLLRNLRPLQRDGLVRAKGGGRGGHVELEITEKGPRGFGQNASGVAFRPGQSGRYPGQETLVIHHPGFGGRGGEIEGVITARMTRNLLGAIKCICTQYYPERSQVNLSDKTRIKSTP